MAAAASGNTANALAETMVIAMHTKLEMMRGKLRNLTEELMAEMHAALQEELDAIVSKTRTEMQKELRALITKNVQLEETATLLSAVEKDSRTVAPAATASGASTQPAATASGASTQPAATTSGARATSGDEFPSSVRRWFIRECSTNIQFIDAYITPYISELIKNAELATLPRTTPEESTIWYQYAAKLVWLQMTPGTRELFTSLYNDARDEFISASAPFQQGVRTLSADWSVTEPSDIFVDDVSAKNRFVWHCC
jgi:hypothetical protein